MTAEVSGTSTLPTTRVWTVDARHSTVGFRVKHHAVGTFRAWFSEFEGQYDAEAGKLTGSAQTASVVTFDMLKEQLLSDDFFAAHTYPTISFESASLRIDGDLLTVEGEPTLRGVTKPVTAIGTIAGPSKVAGFGGPDKEHIGMDLEMTIDRRDFGVDYNNELLDGRLNLGWDVTLELSLELSRPLAES